VLAFKFASDLGPYWALPPDLGFFSILDAILNAHGYMLYRQTSV